MAMTKYIVTKGHTYYDAWRGHETGDVVDIDEAKMPPNPKTGTPGENLRKLTAAELKLTPSELKKRELAEPEAPVEAAVAA